MIHSIRTQGNRTLVDAESLEDDLRVSIDIGNYSRFLMRYAEYALNKSSQGFDSMRMMVVNQVIHDFNALSELRGEYHESNHDKETSRAIAERRCREIADLYGLKYVKD